MSPVSLWEEEKSQKQRGEDHVKMQAEIKVTLPQAKKR